MSFLVEGFKIGAEFVFDAGLASAEIGAVQGKIQQLSGSIDDLLYNAQNFGLNFAASFTGLGGGLIGVFGSAINASDEFKKAQLSFSNIIAANMESFSGNVETFSDRMLSSKNAINDIIKDSRDFVIPAKELLRTTEILGALMAPSGLAGNNFGISRQLSSNFLKSTRSMGVDPSQSMNQFANIVTGNGSEQGMFSQRLFKEMGISDSEGNIIKTAKEWNKFFAQDKIKAIDALNTGMDKFTKNADELAGMTNTISAVWQRLMDLFKGFGSILRPLGDVILPVVTEYLNRIINLVKSQGANIVESIAAFIKPIADAPEMFLVRLMQMKNLAKDVSDAAWITGTALSLSHLSSAIKYLGKTSVGSQVGNLVGKIPFLGAFSKWIFGLLGSIKPIIGLGGGLIAVLGKLSFLFTGLTVIFQALSRAQAKADIGNFYNMLFSSDKIVSAGTRIGAAFAEIMNPIDVIIEGLSDIFVAFIPLAQKGSILVGTLEFLADVMELAGESMREFLGIVMGFVSGIVALIAPLSQMVASIAEQGPVDYIKGLATGTSVNPFEGYGAGSILEAMKNGYDRYSSPYLATGGKDGEKAIAQNNVNIGKVDINNNIKQEVQPDRIAFTMKEQLMKLSENRKGSSGRRGSFSGAFAQ